MTAETREERLKFWGTLVKELRLSRKISQRKLARQTGVARNTIRKIEEGESDPSVYTMERILEQLGHELEALDGDVDANLLPSTRP